MVLEKDVHYKLVAEGQMLIRPGSWGNPSFDYHADAEYTRLEDVTRLELPVDQRIAKDRTQDAASVDVGIRVVINREINGLIQGQPLPSWGPYSSEDDHLLTAVENGGAGTMSRRSKMAAHNRAVLCEGTIGATAPITPPSRERHRSAQRHGDLERDTT